jgi:hypothetical protein
LKRGRVSFINPLDPSQVIPILNRINGERPILDPKKIFQRVFPENSKRFFDLEVQIQKQETLNAIRTLMNEKYACFKLE